MRSKDFSNHERLYADGERGRIEQYLSVLRKETNDVLNKNHKVPREQLISL